MLAESGSEGPVSLLSVGFERVPISIGANSEANGEGIPLAENVALMGLMFQPMGASGRKWPARRGAAA